MLQLDEVQDIWGYLGGLSCAGSLMGSQGVFPLMSVPFWYLSDYNSGEKSRAINLVASHDTSLYFDLQHHSNTDVSFLWMSSPDFLVLCTCRRKNLPSQIFSCSDLCDLLTINFCLEKSRCPFSNNSLGKNGFIGQKGIPHNHVSNRTPELLLLSTEVAV